MPHDLEELATAGSATDVPVGSPTLRRSKSVIGRAQDSRSRIRCGQRLGINYRGLLRGSSFLDRRYAAASAAFAAFDRPNEAASLAPARRNNSMAELAVLFSGHDT